MAVTSDATTLLVERRTHVAYVTINRPEVRNALDSATAEALVVALDELGNDDDVWVIVIRGAGDKAFCAGRDLKELHRWAEQGRRVPTPMAGASRNHYEVVLETYKPTIAAINGAAMGGGFELALACDLRIAVDHAEFGLPEVKRGMGANFASVVLPRMISRARAYEMLYTGRNIGADCAQDWGLVNRVVTADQFDTEVEKLASEIAGNAPVTLRRYKEMVTKGWGLPIPTALRLNVGPNPYSSSDREEGVRAYVEGRTPVWRNE